MFKLKSESQTLRHIICDTFGLFRQAWLENIAAALLLMVVLIVCVIVCVLIAGSSNIDKLATTSQHLPHAQMSGGQVLGILAMLFIVTFLVKLIWVAMIKSNWRIGHGEKYQLGKSLAEAFRNVLPLFVNVLLFIILIAVLVGLYFVLLAIPAMPHWLSIILTTLIGLAFYYSIFTYYLMPATLIIDNKRYKSLFVAFRMIKGNWWRTFLSINITTLITYFVAFLPILVVLGLLAPSAIPFFIKAAHMGHIDPNKLPVPTIYMIVAGSVYFLAAVAMMLTIPGVLSSLIATLYNDLKLRKEGSA